MFANEAAARAELAKTIPTAKIDGVVAALRPGIVLSPIDSPDTPKFGGTRIGGTPDLSPGLDWPIRPVSPDIEAIARRGGPNHGDHIRKHLGRPLPYEFLAQIDLGEAAALGPVAADLPADGRLLVFYDSMSGPWDTGTTTCRVIWDRGPADTLVRQPRPTIFDELGEQYVTEAYEGSVEARRKYSLPPPKRDDVKPPYWGPARPMRLAAMLTLPHTHVAEARDVAALQAIFADAELSDTIETSNASLSERHLLLGLPVPEQDEPRYDAVVVERHGVQHLPRERWLAEREAIFAAATEWRLLLQVSMSDYLQQQTEGTVYFLIRKTDLVTREFGRVVAVYQQT